MSSDFSSSPELSDNDDPRDLFSDTRHSREVETSGYWTAKTLPQEVRDQPSCWYRTCTRRLDRYRPDLKPLGFWVRSCSAHIRPYTASSSYSQCMVCRGEQILAPDEPPTVKRFGTSLGAEIILCSGCQNDHKFQVEFYACRELALGEGPTPKRPQSAADGEAEYRGSVQKKRRFNNPRVKIRVGPSGGGSTAPQAHQLALSGGTLVVRIRAPEPMEALTPARPFSPRVGAFLEYLEVLQKMREDGLISKEMQERVLEPFSAAPDAPALVEAAVRNAATDVRQLPLATALIERARRRAATAPTAPNV